MASNAAVEHGARPWIWPKGHVAGPLNGRVQGFTPVDQAKRGERLCGLPGFYRDARLLICDEPTAALDARAEHHLFEQIREHARATDRTVLLITHRLASVRHAGRIYVLNGGHVTEQGDHQELMNLGGLYAELYILQAAAYHPGESAHAIPNELATSAIEP